MSGSSLGYTPGSGADIASHRDNGAGKHFQATVPHHLDGDTAVPASADNPAPVTDGAAGSLLWRILQVLLSPLGYDKSLQRQRGTVIVESGTVTTVTTVTTVATVTNVTNLNNIDGYNARIQVLGQNQTAWQACVRARIT